MEVLWSPWRSQYISGFKHEDEKKENDCFLCDAAGKPEHDKELLVVARWEHCFAILNKYPYNNGHVLIAPYRHVGDMEELSDDELMQLTYKVKDVIKALKVIYKPHGCNVGINLGRAAGAGVPGHLHYHVVPRWNGDTNFTAVFADVKVVSQSLKETQAILSEELTKLESRG